MKVGKIKSLMLAIFGCFYAIIAYSATSLFSDYGQIQNVQNYSTNPFWTPNSPYNQKLPQPVYVQGTAISNEECVKVLQSSVAMQCMARDNCKNTSLSDIRPAVIVQLSNLPNKAYSTACIGYLDSVYESYVAQYGNNAPTQRVAFPTGTVPNPAVNNNTAPNIKNPYEIKTPQWQQEINERSQELQSLQQQNGAGNERLSANPFPTTYADLSFSERMENEAAGYAPYKDAKAYRELKVYGTDQYCNEAEHRNTPKCMEYICKSDGTYSTTAECVAWLCQNDTAYKNKNKNTCDPQKQQTAKNNFNKKNNFNNKNNKNNNKDKLCAIVGTDKNPTCCKDATDTGCITKLCANTDFATKYPIICKALAEQKIVTEDDIAALEAKVWCGEEDFAKKHADLCAKPTLCPKTKYTIADAENLLNYIQTPNNESAIHLAKQLVECTEGAENYSTNGAIGTGFSDNYVLFTEKGSTKNIKIWFGDLSNHELQDSDHAHLLWRAVCLISGGDTTTVYNIFSNSDLTCKYTTENTPIDKSKVSFITKFANEVFQKANIKNSVSACTYDQDSQKVLCLYN